jgi:S-adenosylmethionine hydrolase
MTTRPLITLLTDFGEHDSYVGTMKGVMLNIAPDATLVDITHQIRPQDIQLAALTLLNVYRYFPDHAVHLVVVDPGVGSKRRAIAMETPHGRFVAPDNGVLTHVQMEEPSSTTVELNNPEYWLPDPSHTFHGRDIFSPAAAHLACGVPLTKLGSKIDNPIVLTLPPLEITPSVIRGEVTRIDRFGNVVTNISQLRWIGDDTLELHPLNPAQKTDPPLRIDAATARVTFGWHSLVGLHQMYHGVPIGQPLALVGSNGELEIAVNQGSASDKLAISTGEQVSLVLKS